MIDLPEILQNKKDIELSPVRERMSSIIALRLIYIRAIKELLDEINRSVIPVYANNSALTQDRADWFRVVREAASNAVIAAKEKFQELFETDAKRHIRLFNKSIKSGAGLDFPAGEINQAVITEYVEQNVSLITSVTNESIERVQQLVSRAKLEEMTVEELSSEIRAKLKISKKRADLIAVDQVASLNADLNRSEQEKVGITHYRWRDKNDGRERPLHRKIRGNIYKWGEKTDAENGLPPGKPIRCRCVAVPVIKGK